MCVGRNHSEQPLVPLRTLGEELSSQESLKIIQDVSIVKEAEEKIELKEDLLAVMTRHTKVLFNEISELYKNFLGSTFYKILFYTTQPAHLITALSVLYIAYLMLPSKSQSPISPLWTLVYLVSFSTHFGAQIWMTFVSGLALYFSIPRHTFGNVQRVLFPKYFLLNATMSLITLAIFLRTKNNELMNLENAVQASGMSLCFLLELVIRLYLTPPLLSLIAEKHDMEKEAGVGMEVGKFSLGKLKKCPHYLKVHKTFRKIHTSIAMLNIVTMACTMLHLYYLSHKLCNV